MPNKKHSLFKFHLLSLLGYLSETYPEYSNFSMYRTILANTNLNSVEDIYNDIKGVITEYKKEILDRNEDFFTHLKPTSISSNFLIINEISNIKKVYHLEKTTEAHKDIIWSHILRIANTFS